MNNKLLKLVNVKSIVTIVVTVVFAVLSLKITISGEQFLMIFTAVIAIYFGNQHEKKGE